MKTRGKTVLHLVLNLLLIVTTVIGVAMYFTMAAPDTLGSMDAMCFTFFTTDSNLFAALTSLLMIVWNLRRLRDPGRPMPGWLCKLRFASVTAVSLTFVTVALFLAPVFSVASGQNMFLALFSGNTFFLHLTTPLLAAVSFVCLERGRTISLRESLWGVLPTTVYALFYVVGWKTGFIPDWYGFTFGGKLWMAGISFAGMHLATFGIATVLRLLHRGKKPSRRVE